MLAYEGCARAMYQSWAVLGLGLAVFALSSFVPTQRFGAMMFLLLTCGAGGQPAAFASGAGQSAVVLLRSPPGSQGPRRTSRRGGWRRRALGAHACRRPMATPHRTRPALKSATTVRIACARELARHLFLGAVRSQDLIGAIGPLAEHALSFIVPRRRVGTGR